MKYFFTIGIALTLFSGAGVAYAQTDPTIPGTLPVPTVNLPAVDLGNGTAACPTGFTQQGSDCIPTSAQATANAQNAGTGAGAGKSPSDVFGPILGVIMSIFAWLLGVAGVLLNDVVYYTVVTMGKYVQNLGAVGVTWRVLRDIGNIILIFGFLAIGISTIIGYDNYGEKRLPALLVIALLLNFSLLISEAIVDVGNIFATQFYTQISGGQITAPDNSLNGVSGEGISNAIVQSLSLQTLENVAPQDGSGSSWLPSGQVIFVGVLAIILFIVAAFVLFTISFILIARFVVLLMLIIVAPVGFAGLLIPKLNEIANDWWNNLIKNTISAPILLLLLYVALRVILDTQFLKGINASGANWGGVAAGAANSATGATGFAGIDLAFGIAMGLLLLCVVVANRLSLHGAGAATKWAGTAVGGFVGYGLFGSASLVGRGVLGGAGRALNNKRMQARAAKGGFGGLAAKGLAFTGRNLESRTYDVRNIPGFNTAAKRTFGAIGAAGLGESGIENIAGSMGKGSTVTAKQVVDTARDLPKTVKNAFRDQQKEYEKTAKEVDRKDKFAAAATSGAAADAVQKELKKMSADEIAVLGDIKKGEDKLVWNLSPSKFGELMKSDKLTQVEKDKIEKSWDRQVATPASAQALLGRLSDDERVALGGKYLTNANIYQNLNADDFDNIRSAKLSPSEKATIATYVKRVHDMGKLRAPGTMTKLESDLAAAAANPKFKAYYGLT